MADFRKSLLLATAALALGVGTASAQTALCNATTGAPPSLRSEGQAELVGSIVLNCTNLQPTTVNFDVSLGSSTTSIGSIPITSGIDLNTGGNEATAVIDQVLLDGSGNIIATNQQVVHATLVPATPSTGFNNIARFVGLQVTIAGSATVKIYGIRGNMNPAYVPITTSFGQVLSIISVSNGILPINQVTNGFLIGLVLPAATANIPGADLNTCSGGGESAAGSFTINVVENFPTAFKQLFPKSPNDPDSEDGPNGERGASTGTQFGVTFNSVPTGATMTIPLQIISDGGGVALLVTSEGTQNVAATDATVVAGSTYFYNVFTANSSFQETYPIPVSVTGLTNTGFTPDVSVTLAPRATVLTTAVPRFIGPIPFTSSGVTVTPCQTTLLFPFVSSMSAGYDTGVAISATSVDPFGTLQQGGTCDMHYYAGSATWADTSLTVPVGGEGHFLVSDPTLGHPGFQGYVIAVCNFAYAHGFAFIYDQSGTGLSEGYVANVIGNTRPGTPSTQVNDGSWGESLGH